MSQDGAQGSKKSQNGAQERETYFFALPLATNPKTGRVAGCRIGRVYFFGSVKVILGIATGDQSENWQHCRFSAWSPV